MQAGREVLTPADRKAPATPVESVEEAFNVAGGSYSQAVIPQLERARAIQRAADAIEQARAAVQSAESRRALAATELERTKNLFASGASSKANKGWPGSSWSARIAA